MIERLPHRSVKAEAQRLTHAVIEHRTGSRYESSSYAAVCNCGWKKIGFQGEARKAGMKHIKEMS